MGNATTLARLKARHQSGAYHARNESPAEPTTPRPCPVPDPQPLVFHPPAGKPTPDVVEEYGYTDRRKAAGRKRGRPPDPNAAAQLIVKAARQLAQPFGRTALVLAAWRADPPRFGLAGCEGQHPDCNKVLSYLYGRRGLIARGLVVPEGDLYRVAGEGP